MNRTQVFHNITKAYTGFYKCIEIIFRKDSKCLHWKLRIYGSLRIIIKFIMSFNPKTLKFRKMCVFYLA